MEVNNSIPYVSFYGLLCVGGGLAVMSTSLDYVNRITGMPVYGDICDNCFVSG